MLIPEDTPAHVIESSPCRGSIPRSRIYDGIVARYFARSSPNELIFISADAAVSEMFRPLPDGDPGALLRQLWSRVSKMLQDEKLAIAGNLTTPAQLEDSRPDAPPPFEDIFRKHGADVYRFCLSQLRNPALAEEMASDVFYRALKAYERTKPVGKDVIPWLFRIAKNAIIDRQRRENRRIRIFDHITRTAEPMPETEHTAGVRAELRLLMEKMKELSERDRMLVGLRVGGDLSYPEIAEITGMSLHTVTVATNRALVRLRQRCQESQ